MRTHPFLRFVAPCLASACALFAAATLASAQERGRALDSPATSSPNAPPTPPQGDESPSPQGASEAASNAPAPSKGGVESRIQLRPVDRATVRIVSVGGADVTAFESSRTGLQRVAAIPRAQHGTGVAIDAAGLILTAKHVVWGSDAVAVLFPGGNEPRPAALVYADPDHDIAFLKVQGRTPHHLELPDAPHPLRLSQRISASGYPIDIRQRYPAAVSGEVSRENNDGSLQVAMSVNPGNSGGPVVDDSGQLIGVLSKRGEPRAGVAGIALVEPLRFVLPAYEWAQREMKSGPPRFRSSDEVMAQVLADFVRTSDEQPIYEQTTVPTVRKAAASAPTPERAMIVAAHAWNMHIALLEARRKRGPEELPPAERNQALRLRGTAVDLSREAVQSAPYLRYVYPIVRSLVNSGDRSYVSAHE